jgi:hypothetical protein
VLPVNGEYLHERLPRNKHDYANAGHFAWVDAADDYPPAHGVVERRLRAGLNAAPVSFHLGHLNDKRPVTSGGIRDTTAPD